jgi:hypothetical protein
MGTLKLTTWVTKEAPALEGASLPPRGRGPPGEGYSRRQAVYKKLAELRPLDHIHPPTSKVTQLVHERASRVSSFFELR